MLIMIGDVTVIVVVLKKVENQWLCKKSKCETARIEKKEKKLVLSLIFVINKKEYFFVEKV